VHTVHVFLQLKCEISDYFFQSYICSVSSCYVERINVVISFQNNIKVIDFGFARADMFPGTDGQYERSETYCGSYAYAAPEILMGVPYIPQAADVWSLGVILYVMVTNFVSFFMCKCINIKCALFKSSSSLQSIFV